MGTCLTFNFEEAVARARRDYPEETQRISFVDLSRRDAKKIITKIVKQQTPFKWFSLERRKEIRYLLSAQFGRFSINVITKTGTIVVESNPGRDLFFEGGKDRISSFNHELGHAVVPSGHNVKSTHRREIAADVFAVLRGLHDGDMAAEDVRRLAAWRLGYALRNQHFEHMTAVALDHISLNKNKLDFVSLTPQQIKAIAEDYAQKFGMTEERLQQIKSAPEQSIDAIKAAFRP